MQPAPPIASYTCRPACSLHVVTVIPSLTPIDRFPVADRELRIYSVKHFGRIESPYRLLTTANSLPADEVLVSLVFFRRIHPPHPPPVSLTEYRECLAVVDWTDGNAPPLPTILRVVGQTR